MSIRTLLIWIIIAGFFGGAVIAIRAQQDAARLATPIASSRTIGFDPGDVVGLERMAGDEREILERDPKQPSRWMIHWSQGGLDHNWGVEAIKVRSGIRALATARVEISDEDLVATPAGAVTIRLNAGDSIRVEFDADSAGGYTAVRIEERGEDGIATGRWFGRIERSVYDALIGKSMLSWRTQRVFEMSNSAVRGVELTAGGASVGLTRANTGWTVQDPIRIHGDSEQIEDLVKALISLQASSFVDDPLENATTGVSSPIATIRIATVDETSTLVIGTRSDVGGSSVYAQLETPTGSALITLEIEQLSKLTAVVEAYIAKTPSPHSTAALGAVRINGRDGKMRFAATRSMGDWMIAGSQADSLNRDAIERLIGVLMRNPAQLVMVLKEDEAVVPFGYVELMGDGDLLLNRFGVALDSTEAGMRLLIMQELESGQHVLWATVSDEAAATGAWLTAVAGKRVP